MKKKLIISIAMLLTLSLTACGDNKKVLDSEISQKKAVVQNLKIEKEVLESRIKELKAQEIDLTPEDNKRYILTIKLKQSHISLSIKDHVKDSMNAVEFDIAVDKEYYDSVEKGDEILNEFRGGSFVTSGSVGSWKLTVEDKEIEVK